MSARILLSTARRALAQLRHDRRTVAMILVVPLVLMVLVYYLFENQPGTFDHVGLTMLGSSLRLNVHRHQRRHVAGTHLPAPWSGSSPRPFTRPTCCSAMAWLSAWRPRCRPYWPPASPIGRSTCAPREHRPRRGHRRVRRRPRHGAGTVLQRFRPERVPGRSVHARRGTAQILLCGLFSPRPQMTGWMRDLSDVMPLPTPYRVCNKWACSRAPRRSCGGDLGIVIGAALLALALASVTLRRRTA